MLNISENSPNNPINFEKEATNPVVFEEEARRIFDLMPQKFEKGPSGWEGLFAESEGVNNVKITKIVLPLEAPPKIIVGVKDIKDDVLSHIEYRFQPDHTVVVARGWPVITSKHELDRSDPEATVFVEGLNNALALLEP